MRTIFFFFLIVGLTLEFTIEHLHNTYWITNHFHFFHRVKTTNRRYFHGTDIKSVSVAVAAAVYLIVLYECKMDFIAEIFPPYTLIINSYYTQVHKLLKLIQDTLSIHVDDEFGNSPTVFFYCSTAFPSFFFFFLLLCLFILSRVHWVGDIILSFDNGSRNSHTRIHTFTHNDFSVFFFFFFWLRMPSACV